MRITDLFENDDQSDAELFGTHGTSVDMRFRLADAFDEYARIRDEAVGEWHPSWRENNLSSLKHEQHVMGMARALADIFRKQGLEPGLRMADSLFRHGDTRQYMWLYDAYDFLRDKKGIDMPEMVAQHFNESTEPSDDELFGGRSVVRNKYISKIINDAADSYEPEMDPEVDDPEEEYENEVDNIRYIANEFEKSLEEGLTAWNRCLRGKFGTWGREATYVQEFVKEHGQVDLSAEVERLYRSGLNEDEPSDEELFGKEEFPRGDIIKLLRDIGAYFHRTYDNEDLLDNADVVLDAADDFEKYGLKAGAERLMDVWSPSMMSYLTAMFRERLSVDINKMFDRFASDHI